MAKNQKINGTEKVDQDSLALSLTTANPNAYPLAYGDDVWDIAEEGSDLATAMDSSGSFTQSQINEVLAGLGSSSAANKMDKVDGATENDFVAFDSEGNAKDSGKKSSDFATAAQGEKADTAAQKVSGATNGHFAGLNSSGDLTDSGKSWNDVTTALTGKQDVINSGNMLNSDYVNDSNSTAKKFMTPVEKSTLATIAENYLKEGPEEGSVPDQDFNPRNDTVHITPQILSDSQQTQARNNIKAQETLLSGYNIKTVNSQSLLGQGDLVIQGEKGDAAYNPFKGYFDSSASLRSSYEDASVGDFAYVVSETDPEKTEAYIWSDSSWGPSGRDVSLGDAMFKSGELVSGVEIDHSLTNPCENDVASADAAMEVRSSLGNIDFREVKVELITEGEGQNVFTDDKYVSGLTGMLYNSTIDDPKYFEVDLNSADSVRFLGASINVPTKAGYAFGHYDTSTSGEQEWLTDSAYLYMHIDNDSEGSSTVEIIANRPERATHLRVQLALSQVSDIASNFYCYRRYGHPMTETIPYGGASIQDLGDAVIPVKNLIDWDNCMWGSYIYYNSDRISNLCISSNKLHLVDGETYTISNVTLNTYGNPNFSIRYYNNDDSVLDTINVYGAVVDSSDYDTGPNYLRFYGHCTFVFESLGEAYVRVGIRDSVATDAFIEQRAQLEVGSNVTTFSKYNAVYRSDFGKVINDIDVLSKHVDSSIVLLDSSLDQLRDSVGNTGFRENYVDIITNGENQNVFSPSYIDSNNGYVYSSSVSTNGYLEIPVYDADAVRFLAFKTSSAYPGYAFGHYDDSEWVTDSAYAYYDDSSVFDIYVPFEIIASRPVLATHFRCQITYSSVGLVQIPEDFYCILRYGKPCSDIIPKNAVSFNDLIPLTYPVKNLIDWDNCQYGYGYISSNSIHKGAFDISSNKIQLKNGQSYTISNVPINKANNAIYYGKFDKFDNYIGLGIIHGVADGSTHATAGNFVSYGHATFVYNNVGEDYIRFTIQISYKMPIDISHKAQLEVGEYPTEFCKYNDVWDVDTGSFLRTIYPIYHDYKFIQYDESTQDSNLNIETDLSVVSNRFRYLKYEIDPECVYYGSGKGTTPAPPDDLYVYYWGTSNGKFIDRQLHQTTNDEWNNYELIPPSNAKYLYVQTWINPSSSSPLNANLSYFKVVEKTSISKHFPVEKKKDLNIVVIGDSYTEDCFAYVPMIIRNVAPDINLTLNILMQSSSGYSGSRESEYKNFIDSSAVYRWSRYLPDYISWRGTSAYNYSIKHVLDQYDKVDIIVLKAAALNSSDSHRKFKWVNKLMQSITEYLKYPVQFMLMSSISSAKNTAINTQTVTSTDVAWIDASIQNSSLRGCDNAVDNMEHSLSVGIFSENAAIQNARSIDAMKALGHYVNADNNQTGYGYLQCIDGNHLADGIGRLIPAYACVAKILQMVGLPCEGILGDKTFFDSSSLNSLDQSEWVVDSSIIHWNSCPLPHPQSTVVNPVGMEKSYIDMAQICAMMAAKDPIHIYNMAKNDEGEDSSLGLGDMYTIIEPVS